MKTLLKWTGTVLLGLVTLLIVVATVIYGISVRKMSRRYQVGASWVRPTTDSASVTRGRHLVTAIAKCSDCHGENLGGTPFINSPVFAVIPAPNITAGRGGAAAVYSDQDLARVIQHGVKRNGRAAVVMPAEAYRYLSDSDLSAIIAYLRTVPPVDSTWPAPRLGPIGHVMVATGQPVLAATYIDHERNDILPAPDPDTTPAYGRYLANVGGCTTCHNPALSGGKQPGPPGPIPANLTVVASSWQESDFVRLLREGTGIGGREINDAVMPWKSSGRLSDAEIHALWLFLRSLPPKELGER